MKKKPASRSAFLNPRVLISLAVCTIGIFLGLLAFALYPGGNARAEGPQQAQSSVPQFAPENFIATKAKLVSTRPRGTLTQQLGQRRSAPLTGQTLPWRSLSANPTEPTQATPTPTPAGSIVLLDTINDADDFTYITPGFTGLNNTYMGDGFTNNALPGGTTYFQIRSFNLFLVSDVAASYTDIVARLVLWSTYAGASNPVFSNPAAFFSVDLGPGDVDDSTLYEFEVTVLAPFPFLVGGPGTNWGYAQNFQGDSGGGLVDTTNLTSLITVNIGGGTYAAGEITAGAAPNHAWYTNNSLPTLVNFNFRNTGDLFTFGVPAQGVGIIIRGDAQTGPTPTPIPTSTATPTPPPTASITGTVTYCTNPTLPAISGVTMTLTGGPGGVQMTNGAGSYTFPSLATGVSYTITPSKTGLAPGVNGINGADLIKVLQHVLTLIPITNACELEAANADPGAIPSPTVDGSDLVAILRFYLQFPNQGNSRAGQYKFTPTNRMYSPLNANQAAQDYSAVAYGDTSGTSGYVHRPVGSPSEDAARAGELSTVAAVTLPTVAVDPSKSNFVAAVTTTAIEATDNLVAFQGDFTFDERVVTFDENRPVQAAGLTADHWNVVGHVLPGVGPIRTLRLLGYANDFTPLSGKGTLFELRINQVKAGQSTALVWAPDSQSVLFIDGHGGANMHAPGNAAPGSVTAHPSQR